MSLRYLKNLARTPTKIDGGKELKIGLNQDTYKFLVGYMVMHSGVFEDWEDFIFINLLHVMNIVDHFGVVSQNSPCLVQEEQASAFQDNGLKEKVRFYGYNQNLLMHDMHNEGSVGVHEAQKGSYVDGCLYGKEVKSWKWDLVSRHD